MIMSILRVYRIRSLTDDVEEGWKRIRSRKYSGQVKCIKFVTIFRVNVFRLLLSRSFLFYNFFMNEEIEKANLGIIWIQTGWSNKWDFWVILWSMDRIYYDRFLLKTGIVQFCRLQQPRDEKEKRISWKFFWENAICMTNQNEWLAAAGRKEGLPRIVEKRT